MKDRLWVFSLIGLIGLLGNWVGYKIHPLDALGGIVIIVALTVVGSALAEYVPLKVPGVVWISLMALFVTSPIFPGNKYLAELTSKVEFMSLATPILAYAGLSLGKDVDNLKKLSWRIIVVSILVYTGTFIFAVLFAEIALRLIHAL